MLHSFVGGDGASPDAGLTNVRGLLYGTTSYGGGTSNDGAVFTITTSGAERVLYSFARRNDGNDPRAGLTNIDDVLYGTTFSSDGGEGTVYKITTSGTESVLHTFGGSGDGQNPSAGLTNVNGVLYGTTLYGGPGRSYGTVFRITTAGTEQVLYKFAGGSDGNTPSGGLINVNGVLYGTTFYGGNHYDNYHTAGIVFKITTSGVKSDVYRFLGGSDGRGPSADLTYVNGVLFGTTTSGGANTEGTVFSLVLMKRLARKLD